MTEENLVREQVLKSIEETAWLLDNLKEAVADAEQVNVALYRSVQIDLTRCKSALGNHHRRIKGKIDLQEPGVDPDYAHWARKHWTIYEAAALAAGREPDSVDWAEPIPLLEWLQSAVKDNRLDNEMKPADFLDWFDSLGDDSFVPPKLRQAIVLHRGTRSTATTNKSSCDNELEAEADIQAVTGSSIRAFEATHILLEFFMRSRDTVRINPDSKQPAVSYSDADNLRPKLAVQIKDAKTIQKHLNHAVETVRRKKREDVARQPAANRRK